jgi:hypothetical protein
MSPSAVALRWRRQRLVDEAMGAYVDWRQQCIDVSLAYSKWAAGTSDVALRYTAYLAALDQEERASEHYAGLIQRYAPELREEDDLRRP